MDAAAVLYEGRVKSTLLTLLLVGEGAVFLISACVVGLVLHLLLAAGIMLVVFVAHAVSYSLILPRSLQIYSDVLQITTGTGKPRIPLDGLSGARVVETGHLLRKGAIEFLGKDGKPLKLTTFDILLEYPDEFAARLNAELERYRRRESAA